PQLPRPWATAQGVVEEEEEEEEEAFSKEELPAAERPEEPSSSDVESVGSPEATLPGWHEQGQVDLEPCSDGAVSETAEDLRTLSSEEEEEEEEERALRAATSILPPSVLDQASVIAERFSSSFSRRSSMVAEEGRASLGATTPRQPSHSRSSSRSSSVLSLEGSATEAQSSTVLPGGNEGDPGALASAATSPDLPACARKGSLLSTQDRLLLDKIKNYYDHAEHQDASFSIKRRESLSYIPKGLVRNSVFRLNSLPRAPPERDGGTRTAVWVLSTSPTTAPLAQPEVVELLPGEDFCPTSAEWQEAERPLKENGLEPHEPLLILEEDDVGAATESPWPASCPQELGAVEPPAPHPRLLQLGAAGEAAERPGTKVYQLARQYSLRIKSRRAGGPRGLAQLQEDMRVRAAAAQEQPQPPAAGTGGMRRGLALPSYEQVVIQEQRPLASLSAAASPWDRSPRGVPGSPPGGSPHLPSPGSLATCSLPSPSASEPFAWPDVRELRSKYAACESAGPRRPPPVNRSRSAPEQVAAAVGRSGRATAKAVPANGRSRSAEAGADGGAAKHQRNHSDGGLSVTAQSALGPGQRVIVLERVAAGAEAVPDAESYVQIRSPTTREKICLKAVVERCKAYQASEEYRRRQAEPPRPWEPPDAARPGLVRNLREKFQTLHGAS
uniref:Uncharacterized protein n=1 Tax=Nothoprocta perdicaria TaxID=30464 RepID=A0A8C7A3V2_NOTPE